MGTALSQLKPGTMGGKKKIKPSGAAKKELEEEENRPGGASLAEHIKAGEKIRVVGELINVSGRDLHHIVCLHLFDLCVCVREREGGRERRREKEREGEREHHLSLSLSVSLSVSLS